MKNHPCSNDEQVMRYINPEHMVSVALNSMRVVEINGIPCNRIDEAAFISAINKRDTALLAPHLAKIKELESDLEECGQLLVDSNELLRQNLPTIQHYEAKIKRLEEALRKIKTAETFYCEFDDLQDIAREALSDTAGSEGQRG